MTEKQLEQIKNLIRETVNGKIDNLHNKIDAYIESDNEWKNKAEPVLQMGKNVQGFGKVSLYIVGFVASVAGAILVVINLLKEK